ncbi:unnamed protein product [Kuraishia capsulata CBS 1993]|uniref:Sm domain-containing protein n=1 Tax=Kuraishia capsulata CBS 1993 TaxID=1382522 RepID=W6MGN8_9ASCO|nr:uncharacterized protein KUCA_T00001293001 [Kuraishia capsulata CBS 1993]CDK25324.1 unnamed protein product [Kuraishia capsulata CBS 1993]
MTLNLTLTARAVAGTLKGYDQLMNLVLDEVVETLKDTETGAKTGERTLGLIVVRSTGLLTISPAEGSEIIDNPFVTAAQE